VALQAKGALTGEAGVDFYALTARLKAAPFQNEIKTRVSR